MLCHIRCTGRHHGASGDGYTCLTRINLALQDAQDKAAELGLQAQAHSPPPSLESELQVKYRLLFEDQKALCLHYKL